MIANNITRYKTTNVSLSSTHFKFRDGASLIEGSHHIASSNHEYILSFLGKKSMTMDFSRSFHDSRIMIESRITDAEFSNSPFDVNRCLFIALSLAIAFDAGFACGHGAQNGHPDGGFHIMDSDSYVFFGSPGQVAVNDDNIAYLSDIYDFVFKSLTVKERDTKKIRLMHLFTRAAIYSGDIHDKFLDFGLPNILNGIDFNLANSFLFIEHALTRTGDKREGGIDLWNAIFGKSNYIDRDDIDVIASYRHSFFHDNPADALKKIKSWSKSQGLNPDDPTDIMRAKEKALLVAMKNIRNIMRAIAVTYDFAYHEFRDKLPG